MKYKELLERMLKERLIEQNAYNTTIDVYALNNWGNSIVVTEPESVGKKTNLTTLECCALRYCALQLEENGLNLMSEYGITDDDNQIQDDTLRLNGFTGIPLEKRLCIDSLFVSTGDNIYAYVVYDADNEIMIRLV